MKTLVSPRPPQQLRTGRGARGTARLSRHTMAAPDAGSSSSDVDGATSRRPRPKLCDRPSPAVQIPKRSTPRRPRHVGSTDAMHPSLAALLAVTDIPRPRPRRRTLVVDQGVSEKDLALALVRPGPLDVLLESPADDALGPAALARTASADSIPSLGGNSFTSDTLSSPDTPPARAPPAPRRPVRRSLEPVWCLASDPHDEHPLAELAASDADDERPAKPLRSALRSNLTASLCALRSAARSLSTAAGGGPPDDLLTRSALAMDPRLTYADERRPPVTEEMPSAEVKRYLNPTTSSLFDGGQAPASRAYSASIQMQTYKIQRSRSPHPSSRGAPSPGVHQPARAASPAPVPGMRQREVRENSDFIRIAVMEMAMRRGGKLDANKPGRARWALPPRRPPTKPYEMGPNGVPARWTPVAR